jgi:hypothetical protein
MYAFFILCTDDNGKYYNGQFRSTTIESGFDSLTQLTREGWKLRHIRCLDQDDCYGNWIDLPAEAFDDRPMVTILQELQNEWTYLLSPSA